jgi:hypothetical protein
LFPAISCLSALSVAEPACTTTPNTSTWQVSWHLRLFIVCPAIAWGLRDRMYRQCSLCCTVRPLCAGTVSTASTLCGVPVSKGVGKILEHLKFVDLPSDAHTTQKHDALLIREAENNLQRFTEFTRAQRMRNVDNIEVFAVCVTCCCACVVYCFTNSCQHGTGP